MSRCFWLAPPPTCAAGGTWLGCWWRGLGDGAPHDGLECLDASTGVVCRVGCFGLRSRRSCPTTAVLERLRCSTPFQLRTESLRSSLWVPSPLYALQYFRYSWSLLVFLVPVSLLPPPLPSPFPCTTVLVPMPSQPTVGYFRGRSARPLPIGPPWPWTRRPPNRCHGPLPCPPPPFLCHARGPFAPIPKSAYSGGPAVRYNPAPRARARP